MIRFYSIRTSISFTYSFGYSYDKYVIDQIKTFCFEKLSDFVFIQVNITTKLIMYLIVQHSVHVNWILFKVLWMSFLVGIFQENHKERTAIQRINVNRHYFVKIVLVHVHKIIFGLYQSVYQVSICYTYRFYRPRQ